MPFGSIFERFEEVDLTTADSVRINFKNTFFSRMGFKILGLPHIGIRLRSRKILQNSPKHIRSMLDAGSGSGVYSFSLARKSEKIESVDIAPEKIKVANKINPFKNIHFQTGDLCSLRFKNSTFDFIVCSDVIEHIKDDKKAFSELARVLQKGGTMLITLPADSEKNRLSYKSYHHERVGYSEVLMKEICRKNGLQLLKTEGYSGPIAEFFSDINYKIVNSKVLLGLLFYPLYFFAIVGDLVDSKSKPNGMFFLIKKP